MAGVEGTTATPAIAGASTGRIQQVVDASEVATKLAVITKLCCGPTATRCRSWRPRPSRTSSSAWATRA
ncbi:MAG: hypothetical protein R3F30_10035 [Planctomycetota bacterium]